jgi:acetyl-CoA carboxylase/biotin carboxylase 1
LSYVPRYAGGPLPILKPFDPIDREIECVPRSDLAVEIRSMLAGEFIENPNDPLGEKLWKSGLLDKDSFFETLGGWAKSIVVGRGRLGGIPLGVLAVDTRSVEQIIPADPADSTSRERVIHKSGQVWFPDSAYKTAQAIRDFNFGEELPLLVLANWRGFSGGQRDMFDEILKFGSFIVDALKDYRKPVFVYIVPNGELRGGAWVVIDPMINPQVMEMYADEHSRGSVLEPSGVVEIKYRKKDIIDTIHRLDKKYIQLAKDLARQDLNHEQKLDIQKQMEKRTQLLIPVYTHVAIQFADLHDTPGRMKAKGVISNTVNWSHARKFFYLRLKRKLAEFDIYAQIANVNRELTHVQRVNILKEWVRQSQANGNSMDDNTFSQLWNDDARILAWIEQHAHEIEKHHLKTLHQKQIERDVVAICNSDLETALDAMINHLKTNVTEPVQRAQLLEKLKKEINSLSL